MKLRIAYFTDTYYPEINGVANTLSRLHGYLDKNQIEHIFFAPEYSEETAEDYILRFKGIQVPFSPNSRLALSLPFHTMIKKKVLEFKPDLIHAVTEFTIGNEGLRIARETGIPLVTSFHTNIDQYLQYFHAKLLEKPVKAYFRNFHSQALLTLCPSRQTYHQLKEQGYAHLDIWSRGVDTELYTPRKREGRWRKQFGEDKFICLYVGRLSFEKGLDIYLDAIRKWNHAGGEKNTVFLFAGDGPYREYLENCGMDNVKLTGFVRGEMLAQLYADSDLFVFPSGTETFGNVLLEAMASGRPCICTDSGGVTDFAVHGKNAYVVKDRDSDALYHAIRDLKENVLLRRKLSEGALKTAKQRSWVLFGSILPDLLYHTYLKGHTWESSFDRIEKRMYELEQHGSDNRFSYLMLGWVLHYVEDFYTLAHNPVFEGGLPSHILYERQLEDYLKEEAIFSEKENEPAMSLTIAVRYLRENHEKYLKKAENFETDIHYIYEAVRAVSSCLLRAIAVNEQESKEAEPIKRFRLFG